MENDLRIVFARPAKTFTAGHEQSWTQALGHLMALDSAAFMLREGVHHEVVRKYLGKRLCEAGEKYLGLFGPDPRRNHAWPFTLQSSDIYNSRNATIAANHEHAGKYPENIREWKPFNGKLNYTHILWIDSDMTFELEDVLRITAHEAAIVSGVAMVSLTQYHFGYFVDAARIAQIEELGAGAFEVPASGNGIWYPTIFEAGLWRKYAPARADGLVPIDFCGSAFLCVRKGVYESMAYPWYQTTLHDNFGRLVDTSEDIGWCSRIRELGWDIAVDPQVRVGHEKTITLMPPPLEEEQEIPAPTNGKALEVLRA
jgi:hypothetical protein